MNSNRAFRLIFLTILSLSLLQACSGSSSDSTTTAVSPLISTSSPTGTPATASAGDLISSPSCSLQYRATASASSTGIDPLWTQQWHLKNTGQNSGAAGEDLNVALAWQLSRGAGVRVAVVDNALETVHVDLADNVEPNASYSYRFEQQGYSDPLPCHVSEGHGTSVAGIIAARADNAIGGAGVATQAKLVGYNALATNTDADLADALNRDLGKNSVYNSSWGSSDDAILHPVSQLHDLALDHGLRVGRNGLGALYVFAAGNGGCARATGDTINCQSDNSNYDGYLTHPGAIVVAATDKYGRAPRYSESGANLLVNAPGGDGSNGITTTMIRDGFTQSFSGTSAAAPMVSGVLALMVGANPALSWRDARIILARTARRNDPTHPSWRDNPRAAAGHANKFSHRFGFGTVDAARAVAASKSWQSVGGSDQLLSCGPFLWNSETPIPDGTSSLLSTVTVPEPQCAIKQIEQVILRINIAHDYSGDLNITLTSPSSTDSELASARRCGSISRDTDVCGEYSNWRFSSVRHLDEPAIGTWRLLIGDTEPGRSGRLLSWSIQFLGR